MTGFTTRWASVHVRQTTEGLLRLDVRMLAREGYLAASPGSTTSCTVTWTGSPAASIVVHHDGDDPDAVSLEYRTRSTGGDWVEVRECMELSRTDCAFGGTRSWFRCLGCGTRRAVLYSVDGRFRCRACHHLAYASTRAGSADRALRREERRRGRTPSDSRFPARMAG